MARTRRAGAPPPARRPRLPGQSVRWRAAALILAGLLAYANSLSGPFIFDDQGAILDNTQIRSLRPSTVLFPARGSPVAGRPVVNVSFAINYALGGDDVVGYHAWNVGVHLLCALLAFGLVRRALESPRLRERFEGQAVPLAFATALLWTVHPLNTEAVDYLTQRTESMMALFYLLTMYASARAMTQERSARWQGLAVASCALGMACKESMVTAPLMVALFDVVFVTRSAAAMLKARGRLYAGLAATWLVLLAVNWSGPRVHSAGFSAGVSAWTYLLNQTVMIVRYVELAVWPRSLVLAYGRPLPLAFGDVLPYAAIVVLLAAATTAALARGPALGFIGAWCFLILAPTSSFVPIATEVGAERRMYLPMVALLALAVVAASVIAGRVQPRRAAAVRAAALGLAAVLLAGLTVLRNREYSSGLLMAETVLERWPSSWAQTMVGRELARAGRHDDAILHLREGARDLPLAHFHLGGELYNQNKLAEAIEQMRAFVEQDPYAQEAVRARMIMGRSFITLGRRPEAVEQLRLVLTMTADRSEDRVTAEGFLADALFQQQQFAEAADHYRTFLTARPAEVSALTNLGLSLSATNQPGLSLAAFRRAVEISPSDPIMRRNLAGALLDQGDLPAALLELTRLLQLKPDDAAGHSLRGEVLVTQGKLAEAEAEFERAVRLDPADDQARQNLEGVKRARRGR